ncbi:response regulator [Roseateles sp.]|uniref:response regulator n=1 Tax=Roseateles sp. TaxID=1971397 RepID=UPI0031CFD18C
MSPLPTWLSRHRRVAWLISALLALAGGLSTAEVARRQLEADFRTGMEIASNRELLALRGLTEDGKGMGAVRLAGRVNPAVRAAAEVDSLDVARRSRPAADVLAVLTDHVGAELSFVVNRRGIIVGEWNRGIQATPLGQDVTKRAYFIQGMQGRPNVFMGLSLTASRRSLYLTAPIYDSTASDAPPVGVISARFFGDVLDRFLGGHAGMTGLLISPHGVVMASSEPAWVLTLVGAPSAERSLRLGVDRQYGRHFEDPRQIKQLPFDPANATVSIRGLRHAVASRPVDWSDPGGPWRLVFVGDLSRVAAGVQAPIAALTTLVLFVLQALLLRQMFHRVARHALEERQQAQNRRYLTILDHSPAGIGVVSGGLVTLANPALLEVAKAEPGQPWPDIHADEASRARIVAGLASPTAVSDVELRVRTAEGQERVCMATFQPLTFRDPATVVWLTDLTGELAAEAEIRRAMTASEEATRNKADFLANMSHELRTPMNAIIGMSDLALQTDLDARQRNYIEKAHRAAVHLLQVIDDILDFSRIEAGKLSLERIPFTLEGPLDHLVQVIGLGLEEKGVELLLNVPADVPTLLVGDPLRLGQVLAHLGRHAARVTQHGEVVVGVFVAADDPGGPPQNAGEAQVTLQFSVRDSGPGLQPAELARMSRRLRDGDTDAQDGSGLALEVCRQLVSMMGGRLWVESMPGVCTLFHFTAQLGLGALDTAPKSPLPSPVSKGRRVLIVDDSRIARDLLAALCRSQGLLPETVTGADEALQLALTAERLQQPFDLVLMDWKMPGTDGLSATSQLRSRLVQAPRIIMVTAFGNDDTLYEAMAALAPGELPPVLAKPVTVATLLGALGTLGAGASRAAIDLPGRHRASTEAATQALAGARILVVEDNAVNQELAKELLEQVGIEVALAGDGSVGLAMLTAEPDGFDGVLMDCQMPEMDGFETTRRLREDPRWRELPVIALTANTTGSDRARILATGMNDHIAKPLNVEVLFATLSRWVRPRARSPGEGPGAPLAPLPPLPMLSPIPPIDGVEARAGMASAGHNAALYLRLLHIFRQTQQDTLARIDQALARGDWETLGRIAHTLHGSAGTIGALSLSEAAAALEQDCLDEHADAQADPEAVSRRRELTARMHAALERLLRALGDTTLAAPSTPDTPGPTPHAHDAVSSAFELGLARLREQLHRHDAVASETAEGLRDLLYRHPDSLAQPRAARLHRALEAAARFEFGTARRLLDEEQTEDADARFPHAADQASVGEQRKTGSDRNDRSQEESST